MLNSEMQPIETKPEKQASKTFRSSLKNTFARALPSLAMILASCKGIEAQNPQAAANEALNQPENQIGLPTKKEPGQQFLDYMERGVSITVNIEGGDSWTIVLDKLGIPIESFTQGPYKKVRVSPRYGQTIIEITDENGDARKTTLAIALTESLQPGTIIRAVAPEMKMADYDEEMGTAEPESEAASPSEPDQQ